MGRDAINVDSAMGEPIRTIPMDDAAIGRFAHIAFDGKRGVIADKGTVLLFHVEGEIKGRFSLGADIPKENYERPFLLAGQREIMIFDY
jgi:hypothetical protein